MTKQDKQAFEHQRPPLADFINQETTNKVKRTITIDPFLDEWLGQDHINASGLINRLVKMYQAEQEYFSKIPKDQEKKSDSETYGQGWNEEKKSAVRERDGKVCQDPNCGISQKDSLEKYNQKLHVHHLIKAKEIADPQERNHMDNLVSLCKQCHYRWEKMSSAGIKPQIDR